MVGYIAPVKVYPGELEMEAMALWRHCVFCAGKRKAKSYSGVPVWSSFELAGRSLEVVRHSYNVRGDL